MKKLFKYLLTVVVIVLSALTYVGVCFVLAPKTPSDAAGTNYYRGKGFLAEPAPSDILIFGNSDAYAGFSPCRLYEDYGYTSYISGVPCQTIAGIDGILNKVTEKNKPKIAILETDCLYQLGGSSLDQSFILLTPFIFHCRWKSITKKDFTTPPNIKGSYDIAHGFELSDREYQTKDNGYMKGRKNGVYKISVRNEAKLDYFMNTCKKMGIEVIFVELPSMSSWSMAKSNEITALAKKYKVNFYDLNLESSGYSVDYLVDYRDKGDHLNIMGAEKATRFIGKILSLNYSDNLTDRRLDEKYAYWNEAVNQYEAARIAAYNKNGIQI